jgi:hypothetical protein
VAADAGVASLRIDPSVVKVAKDTEFTVHVVQDSPVATSGAQASVDFDPEIVQVVSVSPAGIYAKAPFILPKDLKADVEFANHSGRLAQVAAAFIPPNAVPAGDAAFLDVTFRVIGCGQMSIELPIGVFDAQMIDGREGSYGAPVPVDTSAGSVLTCVDPSDVTPAANLTSASDGIPFPLVAGVTVPLILAVVGGLALSSRRREGPR